jgi:DNA mismatch repair protein MutL
VNEARRRVHILPDDLANQIAAGEVVERPASVVKELVENALDAGARRIRVDIESGGVLLVRVADDGAGMDRADASLAVVRHATSKIGSIDDLRRIQSFGFRGEALPSIASVSRFALRSRRREDDEGTEVRIEGGAPAEVAPCGCAVGTSVEVRELFFNVPARRKFLRAVTTESAHVTEVVEAAALCRPDVTLILARDGRVAREWLRAQSREERARDVFEDEPLAACRGERGPLSVEALLSRPERARSGATRLLFFVNGRPVKDRTLARMVANAYGSVLEPGRYPVGVVHIDLPPDLVDVNVHPQKAEVRFADGRAVGDALYKIVAAPLAKAFGLPAPAASPWMGHRKPRLGEESAPPAMSPGAEPQNASGWLPGLGTPPVAPPPFGQRKQRPADEDSPATTWSGSGRLPAENMRPAVAEPPPPEPDPWGLADESFVPAITASLPADVPEPMRADPMPAQPVPYPTAAERAQAAERPAVFGALSFVAQVRRTFLVCEGLDGLYVMDQHAAAERVTFDRLRRAYEARTVAAQRMLIPEIVTVTADEAAIVEEAQDAIARTGLEVTLKGPREAAITAVPQILAGRASPVVLLRDLLGELGRHGERAFSGAIDLALATMACHGSVRAGDVMAPEEARSLLLALDEVDFAGHCPHGRPVVMRIRWSELEQKVGRR